MLQRGKRGTALLACQGFPSGATASISMIERGTIEQINARGRVTVRLADRRVVADIHSGSGGCVGDVVEGEMQPGMHSWRNVGNSILSVVHVVEIQPIADAGHAAVASAIDRSLGKRHSDPMPGTAGNQNSARKLS
jgi:hypothetical protein